MHPLRVKRLERGWTQEHLEALTHIDAADISRIEHCRQRPSIATLRRLATALECPVETLLISEELETHIRQHGTPDGRVTRPQARHQHARTLRAAAQQQRARSADLRMQARTTRQKVQQHWGLAPPKES